MQAPGIHREGIEMICAWCYQPIEATDRSIVNRHDETVHLECAETEVGLGVDRTAEQYMRYMGMSDDEIRAELGDD